MQHLFKSRVLLAVAVTALIASPVNARAQSGTFYLSATSNPPNTVTVSLAAGLWNVGVSGGGWSPWNSPPENCDAFGANCRSGFHTVFYYTLNDGTIAQHGADGTKTPWASPTFTSAFFETPELASANALAPFTLELAAPTTLRLFIIDNCENGQPCYWDNAGGVDVTVSPTKAVVSEPPISILAAFGVVFMLLVAYRSPRVDAIKRAGLLTTEQAEDLHLT